MFGQSLLSAFDSAVACTTDTDQLFATDVQTTSVATYQFNNATTSIPNNTYPATASNQTYTTGKFGNAIEANGSNTRVDISNLNVSTFSAITISAWVYWRSTDAPKIFGGKSGSVTNRQTFEAHGNANRVRYIDNQQDLYDAPITLATGWHHFAVTDDYNGNHIIYVDGQAITSNFTVSSSYSANSSATMFYGMRNTGSVSGSETKGIVDQLRIFNTVLPQSAITVLYNETTTTASSASIDYVDANSIAYYKMSDATDQLGNYNGTASNVNFNTEGKFGFAGAFNGSSSYMNTSVILSSTNYSISFWNLKGISGNNGYSLGSTDVNLRNGIIFNQYADATNNGMWNFIPRNSTGGNVNRFQGGTSQVGVWQHIVITYDSSLNGGTTTFYQDGALMTNVILGTNPLPNSTASSYANQLVFGRPGAYTPSGYFNGSIDQVRIYDATLSAANVTALYNEIECPAVAVTNAFNTVLYTGNGGTQSISSLDFQPDLVWLKSRESVRNHMLATSLQPQYNYISTNLTDAEATSSARITSLDSNGFTIGSSANVNSNNVDYVSWNWKAGGPAVAAASVEATSATRSANPEAGFSIIKFQSSASTASPPPMNYIEHGLDATPEMVIYKKTNEAQNWVVQSAYIQQGQSLKLNLSDAVGTNNATGFFDNTSTSIGVRSNFAISRDDSYIAYAFHSVEGYSKIGSYTGTGATGNVQYVGFKPSFILLKNTSSGTNGDGWFMFDTTLSSSDVINVNLQANTSDAESGPYAYTFTVSNTGFEPTGSFANFTGTNSSGNTYIYLAIA